MEGLREQYTNEYFQQESVLTGRPKLVNVMLENESDEPFWKAVLTTCRGDMDYNFTHYSIAASGLKVKGKPYVMTMAQKGRLGNRNIACVDSDYDWILERYTHDGAIISGNSHIVQTFAYAVENLTCIGNVLPAEFANFISRLSNIIYPFLQWALYLRSIHQTSLISKAVWNRMLKTQMSAAFDSADDILDEISARVQTEIAAIEAQWAGKSAEKDTLIANLALSKGLTSQNAYWFVYGHALGNFVWKTLLRPLARQASLNVNDAERDFHKNIGFLTCCPELEEKVRTGIDVAVS